MSYAIDVSRERVRRAMIALGIDESELQTKAEEEFTIKGVSPDIRKLRYSFFLRKQQELVRQLKAHIKDEYLRSTQQKSPVYSSEPEEHLVSPDSHNEMLKKAKKQHKKILLKHLENVKTNITEIKAIEFKQKNGEKIRQTVRTSLSKQRVKMLEFRQKQQENLEKQKETGRLKSLTGKIELSPGKFHHRKTQSPKIRFKKLDSEIEEETQKKILDFEERMGKSKEINESFLQNRKEAASRLYERTIKTFKNTQMNKDLEYAEKLVKIVEKSQQVELRRSNLIRTKTERRVKQKEIEEERRLKTLSKLSEQNKDLEKKQKDIEEKMHRSEHLLNQKQEQWLKELELRNELQRLRDEETLLNAERKKRVS